MPIGGRPSPTEEFFEMKRLSSMFLNPPNGGLTLGFSIVLLIFALVPAFAHGDFDHIRGTVVKVANNVLSIKTTKGTVEVKLDNHTDLTRNERKAQLTDLKRDARVIVDVPKGNKELVAYSVKIGTVPPATGQHKH
jgi:hypothetical protein